MPCLFIQILLPESSSQTLARDHGVSIPKLSLQAFIYYSITKSPSTSDHDSKSPLLVFLHHWGGSSATRYQLACQNPQYPSVIVILVFLWISGMGKINGPGGRCHGKKLLDHSNGFRCYLCLGPSENRPNNCSVQQWDRSCWPFYWEPKLH